ncbi:hypothetical protein KI387_016979, partial [Taxus chinensis]
MKDANWPVRPKRGTVAQGKSGRRDAESQFGRRRRKSTNCSGHLGREDAKDAKRQSGREKREPISG